MMLVIEKKPVQRILKWLQNALFACAILLLGFCGFVLVDAWVVQHRESRDFDRRLSEQKLDSHRATLPESSSLPKSPMPATMDGPSEGLIGKIEIPRLGLSAVVLEGDDGTTLRRAIGHIPGTVLPGETGNVGLAGHRDTFFRPLRDLRVKDQIEISTLRGNFKYEVESLWVVEPDDVRVLAQSDERVLTIVTCYPFSYIGAAPKRFIARARQIPGDVAQLLTVE